MKIRLSHSMAYNFPQKEKDITKSVTHVLIEVVTYVLILNNVPGRWPDENHELQTALRK